MSGFSTFGPRGRAGWRAAIGHALTRAATVSASRAARAWRIMQTRQGLQDMDDRMLQDLGISRAQADFELSRAPWAEPSRSDPNRR